MKHLPSGPSLQGRQASYASRPQAVCVCTPATSADKLLLKVLFLLPPPTHPCFPVDVQAQVEKNDHLQFHFETSLSPLPSNQLAELELEIFL